LEAICYLAQIVYNEHWHFLSWLHNPSGSRHGWCSATTLTTIYMYTTIGGRLWTSDWSVAEISTWQHKTLSTDRLPWPRRDYNLQSHQASSRRPMANLLQLESSSTTHPLPCNAFCHPSTLNIHPRDCLSLALFVSSHNIWAQNSTSGLILSLYHILTKLYQACQSLLPCAWAAERRHIEKQIWIIEGRYKLSIKVPVPRMWFLTIS
jgi:hypothetical protein